MADGGPVKIPGPGPQDSTGVQGELESAQLEAVGLWSQAVWKAHPERC